MTTWANNVGFEYIFSRQVEMFALPGDLLLGISTSGRSPNVIQAFKTVCSQELKCVALLGGNGCELLNADIAAVCTLVRHSAHSGGTTAFRAASFV